MNIYIGNLPYSTTEQELVELFESYGPVVKASLVMDRQTGRPRGFGFVEMEQNGDGRKAIDALAGELYNGRHLTINEARNRQEDGPAQNDNSGDDNASRSDNGGESSGGYSRDTGSSGFGRIGGGYTNTLLGDKD